MSEINKPNLEDAIVEIEALLSKQKIVNKLVTDQNQDRKQLVENLIHKQNTVELESKLAKLHPADIARVLELMPLENRLIIWNLIKSDIDGEILLEVSDAVRETLISSMDSEEIVAAAEQLDADEIADLVPDLPEEVIDDVVRSLPPEERNQLRNALLYPKDSAGGMMDFDMLTVRDDVSIEVVTRYIRRFDDLPEHTDQIFVVNRKGEIKGVLPISTLLTSSPDKILSSVMHKEFYVFKPEDPADLVVRDFEKYDLTSAAVINNENNVVGRLKAVSIFDYIREDNEEDVLKKVGLRDEDLFSSVWKSVQNRSGWIVLNLFTAFVASRVISLFEGSIEKLVALATLMPIIVAIAGNSGNQTITIIVRALDSGDISRNIAMKLLKKELTVSVVNGLIWGSVAGTLAALLYANKGLGFVMMSAMVLNLVVAAFAGMMIPLTLKKFNKDPAIGSSILLTFTTDCMGFLIFLGMASVLLL